MIISKFGEPGHLFCSTCGTTVSSYVNTCPLCRQNDLLEKIADSNRVRSTYICSGPPTQFDDILANIFRVFVIALFIYCCIYGGLAWWIFFPIFPWILSLFLPLLF